MADRRGDFGRRGEDAACAYLLRHGYRIVERNYRCRRGEIDIIAAKDGGAVFVEVKTRRSLKRTTALHYLQQCGGGYNKIAFDVIEIVADDGKAKLRHLQNCF